MTNNIEHLPNDHIASVITPGNIKQALFHRFYDGAETNPLESLTLVESTLSDPTFPRSSHGRQYVLLDFLTTFVVNELKRHRQLMEIPTSPPETSITEVYEAINRDAQTCNSELIGWSWIYYRYVNVAFSISQTVFAQLTCLDERTVRRYQDRMINRLVQTLIDTEWKACRKHVSQELNTM